MQHAGTDWTCFWRQLAQFDQAGQAALHDHFIDRAAFDAWSQRYRQRLALNTTSTAERQASMNAINPVYVLRNHLAEIAIRQAQQGDFSEIPRLQACLAQPYSEKSEYADYAKPAPDWAAELSVSCSS